MTISKVTLTNGHAAAPYDQERAERAVREGRITTKDRQQIIKLFNESMNGYTYYERED